MRTYHALDVEAHVSDALARDELRPAQQIWWPPNSNCPRNLHCPSKARSHASRNSAEIGSSAVTSCSIVTAVFSEQRSATVRCGSTSS